MELKYPISWAFIVSLFTITFYWFGYWYIQGSLDYFGIDIGSLNFSLPTLLITGFLSSVNFSFWLVLLLMFYSLSPLLLERRNDIFHFLIKTLLYIIPFKKNKILNFLKEELKLSEIRQEIKEQHPSSSLSADLIVVIHTTVFYLFLLILIQFSEYSMKVQSEGRKDMARNIECTLLHQNNECSSKVFREIEFLEKDEVKNKPQNKTQEKWFLTNICSEGNCIVFNSNKEGKIVELKDIQVKKFHGNKKTYESKS